MHSHQYRGRDPRISGSSLNTWKRRGTKRRRHCTWPTSVVFCFWKGNKNTIDYLESITRNVGSRVSPGDRKICFCRLSIVVIVVSATQWDADPEMVQLMRGSSIRSYLEVKLAISLPGFLVYIFLSKLLQSVHVASSCLPLWILNNWSES